jgi:hypothetical protein
MANPTPALETQIGLSEYWNSQEAATEVGTVTDWGEHVAQFCAGMGEQLMEGLPYYVDPMICDLMTGSVKDFPDIKVRDLLIPATSGWIHFAVPLVLSGPTLGPSVGIKGFSWSLWQATDQEDEMISAIDPSRATEVTVDIYLDDVNYSLPRMGWQIRMMMDESWSTPIGAFTLPFVEGMNPWAHDIRRFETPDDIPEGALEIGRETRRYFMAFLAFIEQTLITVSDGRPDRATRRRLQKWFHEDPIIKVVKLRRSESARSPDPSNAGDWAFQWLVSGHWRRQWYPASNRHKPIWISPHVKGPENKPLKRASIQLYSVER